MARSRRLVTYISIGLLFLTSGIEYAVIFPTVWLYLTRRFQATTIWLGGLVSAYSVAGLIFGPVFGRIADKTRNTRYIVLFGYLFMICGSCMYSMGIAPWFLMLSRFVAGIGGSVGGAAMTNVAWSTTDTERTFYIAIFMGCRQLGLVIGPAFNLFLREFHFQIGPFKIDSLSSPGVFMACLSLLCQFVFLFCYFDLDPVEKSADNDTVVNAVIDWHSDTETIPHTASSFNAPETDVSDPCECRNQEILIKPLDDAQSWKNIILETTRPEIVAVLFVSFSYLFNQGALESALTPLSLKLYDFGELENSWLYLGCGVEIVIMFILIMVLSNRINDRWMFLLGMILILFSLCWYISFIPRFPSHDRSTMPLLLTGLLVNVAGLPLVAASSLSLLTKMVPIQNQGIMQGIRRFVLNIALILGPIWTGGALRNLYLFFAVLLVVYIIALVLMSDSWHRIGAFQSANLTKKVMRSKLTHDSLSADTIQQV